MDETKSKVFIKLDSQGRIIQCEGGYTMRNIDNVDEWILIDEGEGDKYNLCQTHYFEGGLYNENGICLYTYEDGVCRTRMLEEIENDKTATSPLYPSIDERVSALEADNAETKEALEMILNGVTE